MNNVKKYCLVFDKIVFILFFTNKEQMMEFPAFKMSWKKKESFLLSQRTCQLSTLIQD
jgi:hypothetical protein